MSKFYKIGIHEQDVHMIFDERRTCVYEYKDRVNREKVGLKMSIFASVLFNHFSKIPEIREIAHWVLINRNGSQKRIF